MLTADDIRNMNAEQFSKLLNRMGLDVQTQLELAILHGTGDDGVLSFSGQDMISAQVSTKTMSYEEMAKFANWRLADLGNHSY